jgi:hypothetical protein
LVTLTINLHLLPIPNTLNLKLVLYRLYQNQVRHNKSNNIALTYQTIHDLKFNDIINTWILIMENMKEEQNKENLDGLRPAPPVQLSFSANWAQCTLTCVSKLLLSLFMLLLSFFVVFFFWRTGFFFRQNFMIWFDFSNLFWHNLNQSKLIN